MDGEQHTPSNETNNSVPVYSGLPAQPVDEQRPSACFLDFPASSPPERPSHFVGSFAQNLKMLLINEMLLLSSIMGIVCMKVMVFQLIFEEQYII
jgi:hypothetical protein